MQQGKRYDTWQLCVACLKLKNLAIPTTAIKSKTEDTIKPSPKAEETGKKTGKPAFHMHLNRISRFDYQKLLTHYKSKHFRRANSRLLNSQSSRECAIYHRAFSKPNFKVPKLPKKEVKHQV